MEIIAELSISEENVESSKLKFQKKTQILIVTLKLRCYCNGQAERMNSTIKQMLTKLSIDNPKNWYKFVPRLQRAMNDTILRCTGFKPFQLMFGVEMKNKETFELAKVIEDELTQLFIVDRSEQRKEAAQNIHKAQCQNMKQYNKGRKDPHMYMANKNATAKVARWALALEE